MKHWLRSTLLNVSLLTTVGASTMLGSAPTRGPSTVTTITTTIGTVTTTPTATALPAAPQEPFTDVPSTVPVPPTPAAPVHPTATPEPAPTEGPNPPPAKSTTAAVPPPVGVSGVVRPIMVNLREGPGATYPIRASYRRETRVEVLGRDRSSAWLRVVTPDERAGWMASNCVRLPVALASIPIVDGIPDSGGSAGGMPAESTQELAVPPAGGVPSDSGVETKAAAVPNISDAPKGLGVVIVPETSLHIAPGSRTEVVQTLREEEQVKLFGQAKGAWVRVQPFTAVVPGWVYAAHLRPLPGAIEGTPLITATATLSTTTIVTSEMEIEPTLVALTPTPTRAPAVVDGVPEPAPDTRAVPPPARVPVEIAVEVVETTAAPSGRRGATPIPASRIGVAGMRVALVTVFGDVLVEAVTPVNGRVTFTRDVPANTAVFVQIPALGLRTQLPPEQVAAGTTSVTVIVPSVAG